MLGGALLGAFVALVSLMLPGGANHWLLHAWTVRFALLLSLALIASGAVLRRQELQGQAREPRTLP
jgi:hypothetical protein